MTMFDTLTANRRAYIDAARSNGFEEGLRKLLADLYPDNAHFIYELLQNAEDAHAREVNFELRNDGLLVEHDGSRIFNLQDIESITGIGQSTKADEATSIGKFGVGFKAVFAYTQTPQVQSGEYAFAIQDLFVPTRTEPFARNPDRTTFWFPFDRPGKNAAQAIVEVSKALTEISRSTLLFLDNIRLIATTFLDGNVRLLERRDLDEHIIEIDSLHGDSGPSYWYRIQGTAPVDGTTFPIAAAFSLTKGDKMADKGIGGSRSSTTLDARNFTVEPVDGRVFIYFPAVKETSGLKFHIHAPFASTVARDSVREGDGNDELLEGIAALVANALPHMRDAGLLDDGLLSALPNKSDDLPRRYEPLRKHIIWAFETTPITPVLSGSNYDNSTRLIRSVSPLRAALDLKDADFLRSISVNIEDNPATGWLPEREGRPRAFFNSLNAIDFATSELGDAFERISQISEQIESWGDDAGEYEAEEYVEEEEEEYRAELRAWHSWIADKSDPWLRSFYTALGRLATSVRNPYRSSDPRSYSYDDTFSDSLRTIPVLRVQGSEGIEHVAGPKAYLPAAAGLQAFGLVLDSLVAFDEDDEGGQRPEAAALRQFYASAGTKKWDAAARLSARFRTYSSVPAEVTPLHVEDLVNLQQLISERALAPTSYANAPILVAERVDGSLSWSAPSNTFIDSPFRASGLSALYRSDSLGRTPPLQLVAAYDELEIDVAALAGEIGAITGITIKRTPIWRNAQFQNSWRFQNRETSKIINQDWVIPDFAAIVETHDANLLQGLWDVVARAGMDKAGAIYRANASAASHRIESQLMQALTTVPWILDRDGNLRLPADTTAEDLADGLAVHPDSPLLERAHFGRPALLHAQKERGEEDAAKVLGFPSPEAALKAKEMLKDWDLFQAFKQQEKGPILPEGPSPTPERRAQRVREQATDAPLRQYAERIRQVRIQEPGFRSTAKSYLTELYSNEDGIMVCQVCNTEMPFKVSGQYYFEAVQFAGDVTQDLTENRLALCPTCAAKYRHACSTPVEELREDLLTQKVGERGSVTVSVTLAGKEQQLRFVGKHAIDLQAALEAREMSGGADQDWVLQTHEEEFFH
ncbi:hypothetical protein QNO03_05595 [Arthrobacter sp. zg-Y877]|nr:hypothetical protein [Arthrobacter sp. zg-Y877]